MGRGPQEGRRVISRFTQESARLEKLAGKAGSEGEKDLQFLPRRQGNMPPYARSVVVNHDGGRNRCRCLASQVATRGVHTQGRHALGAEGAVIEVSVQRPYACVKSVDSKNVVTQFRR